MKQGWKCPNCKAIWGPHVDICRTCAVDKALSWPTVTEAAERLDMTPSAVRQNLYSGRFKGQKMGGIWRVHPDSIESYNPETRRGPTSE